MYFTLPETYEELEKTKKMLKKAYERGLCSYSEYCHDLHEAKKSAELEERFAYKYKNK